MAPSELAPTTCESGVAETRPAAVARKPQAPSQAHSQTKACLGTAYFFRNHLGAALTSLQVRAASQSTD